jgi:hypothetical protein
MKRIEWPNPGYNFSKGLYVNARGLKLVYNILVVSWWWLTQKRHKGHWYFDR